MSPPKAAAQAAATASSEDRDKDTAATNAANARTDHQQQREEEDTEDTPEDGDDHDDYDDDDDDDENDDDTSSDYSSVSADGVPPIRAYGHVYHGSGRLFYPHDDDEVRRLTLQHELYKMVLDGRLHDARLPIEKNGGGRRGQSRPSARQDTRSRAGRGTRSDHSDGDEEEEEEEDEDDDSRKEEEDEEEDEAAKPTFHILDVGSGNGLWAVEVARKYPNADVLGIDLTSALLPQDVPPNLTFEIADAAEPWPARLYDFIHMRNLSGGGVSDWETLASRAMAHLKPGGVFEFSEAQPRPYGLDPEERDQPLPLSLLGSGGGGGGGGEGEPAGLDSRPVVVTAMSDYCRALYDVSREMGVDLHPAQAVAAYLAAENVASVNVREDWVPMEGAANDQRMKDKSEIVKNMFKLGESILFQFFLFVFFFAGRERICD